MFKHQVRDHIPVDRALTCSVEGHPIPELIEEIMATSTSEFFDLGLEEDIEEMLEEVSDAEEESSETSELLATEKPSRPPIELKPLPSRLRYAFLNSDVESPVIISDKLSEEETNKLIAVLEKHRSVLGYPTRPQGHQSCPLYPPNPFGSRNSTF